MAQPSTASTPTVTRRQGSDRLRLRPLDRPGRSTQYVDGGWWPRTRDLAGELPELLAALATTGIRPYRLMYDLDEWDTVPRKLTIAGRPFKPGGYHLRDAHTIAIVNSLENTRTVLLVIPPETDAETAERAMVLAADPAGSESAAEMLSRVAVPDPVSA